MARIIVGEIACRIRLVSLRYIVHRTHRLLGMLVRLFLVFMKHWITNKQTIMDLTLRWMVSFVIKLFLF